MALACRKVNLEFETDDLQTGSTTNTGTMLTCRGVYLFLCVEYPPHWGRIPWSQPQRFASQVEGI